MTLHENPELKKFIDDFKLRQPTGVISFKAYVEFNMHDFKFQKVSEVQVITSTHSETIYFLDPEIVGPEFPDMLKLNMHEINYVANKMIILTGENIANKYIITIMPLNHQ